MPIMQALQGGCPQLWPRKFRRILQMGADSYLPDFSGSNVLGTMHEPGDVVKFGPQGVHLGSEASDTRQG